MVKNTECWNYKLIFEIRIQQINAKFIKASSAWDKHSTIHLHKINYYVVKKCFVDKIREIMRNCNYPCYVSCTNIVTERRKSGCKGLFRTLF